MVIEPQVVAAGVDSCKVMLIYAKSNDEGTLRWEDVGPLVGWVHSVKENEFAQVSAGKKTQYERYGPPAALTRALQPLASGNSVRCLYGRHKGAYRAWVEFNPTLSQLGELHFHLQLMFEQGFETMRRHGVISEVEFFVDVDGACFGDHLYVDTALRTANPGFAPAGTMYLGSMYGNRSATIYDKAKQLAETKKILLPAPRLRLEAKVRGCVHEMKNIEDMANPFATLQVIAKDALESVTTPAATAFRKHLAWGLSAQAAYVNLSPAYKKDLAEALPALRPSWWDPDAAWITVKANLGWMATLSVAGITGEYLPMGDAAYTTGNIVAADVHAVPQSIS